MNSAMPLGKKLILTYLLVGILPAILVAGTCLHIAGETQNGIIRQSLDSFRSVVDQAVEQTRRQILSAGQVTMTSPRISGGFQSGDPAILRQYAKSVLEGTEEINIMGYANPDGKVILWEQEGNAPGDVSKQEAFQAAAKGEFTIAFSSSELSAAAMTGYFPARDDEGKVIGVTIIANDLTKHALVDSVKKHYGVECTLFIGDMRVSTSIVDDKGQRAVGTRMTNPAVVSRVLQNKDVFQDHNIILGKGYNTVYWPVLNAAGDAMGMFFVGMPDTVVSEAARAMTLTVLLCIAGAIVLTLLVASLVTRSVVNPIVDAIGTLKTTASVLTDSASDIAGMSGELVEAANDQAGSMENSVTSLNDLTQQSKQNTETAHAAKGLMDDTMTMAQASNETMNAVLETMNRIKDSSDKVSGIVKTIEEISFQTNLLALNAAVEAARAGEAGKGFAVVADEVRNLAQRAGEAAKNTSELIGTSVNLSNKGAEEVGVAATSLTETLENTGQVGRMISDVEVASGEQSHNIEQINAAVASMDRSTQRIADSSTHVAETSKVLEEKSGDMDMVVERLTAIVGAKRLDKARTGQEKRPQNPKRKKPMPRLPLS